MLVNFHFRIIPSLFWLWCISFFSSSFPLSSHAHSQQAHPQQAQYGLPPLEKGKGVEKFANFKKLIPPDLYFTLSHHRKIPVRLWRAEGKEKAVILAFHGFNDSRDAWEIPAALFTQNGITLYAPDLEGFGGTAERGHWPTTKTLVNDALQEAWLVHSFHPNVPLYLMGESMGAAVLMVLEGNPTPLKKLPPVAGTIYLAPAIRQIGTAANIALDIATALAPDWTLEPSDMPKGIKASNNQLALIRTYYNPLTLHSTPLSSVAGLVELMDLAYEAAPKVPVPALIIYGGKDQLIPQDSMGPLAKTLPSSIRFDFIPNGHHLLLRDKEYATTTTDILTWIFTTSTFLPSGGDIAAAAWIASAPWESDPFPLAPAALLDP
ncbi:alpha/beta hydrolase [Entomobacter blattae]|uniref:Serine aminopeptidase, S33 n=1 Tax=Entomobacter blattae TaxID=2762277 RepID=A0A7H1NNU7_9PROT|nr:alpha/beta fold hydrolase [Entomobacter blattae]QNT77457.1 Serine aminopeptidase, S33 [Entomobacter blattae]